MAKYSLSKEYGRRCNLCHHNKRARQYYKPIKGEWLRVCDDCWTELELHIEEDNRDGNEAQEFVNEKVEPQPEMPLRDIFLQEHGICVKCYGGANCPYNDVLEDCPIYQKLVSHDQQVRKEERAKFESSANAWNQVWEQWENNPIFKEISQELCNDGCYGAATHINAFIEKLLAMAEGGR